MDYRLDRIKKGEKMGFHDLFPGDDMRAINQSIHEYKQQSELAMKELEDTKKEKDVEKRRINEKQIRALRSNYRRQGGFLNQQGLTQVSGATETGLPNKMGV